MKNIFKFTALSTIILSHSPAVAELYFDEPLSFGSIIITDNSTVGSITVPAYGNTVTSGGVMVLTPGNPAELVFTDYIPYSTLTVTPMLPVTTSITSGITEQFTLDQIDIPSRIRTDSAGMARVKMGGRLTTSGNGGRYINTAYKAVFHIDISY
ncbi:DUF4402 domain-containing protein [Shewanella youngdeokensis]|uniref:DUF4402 domain-containing protein n=1 Tax=Shewanella youngdeokensis TaxID=2999068 RepID=A0ABZ0K1J4_9GAMM|nr:DUF4402 domain-containing protein [Shewanella sp. DAU334]